MILRFVRPLAATSGGGTLIFSASFLSKKDEESLSEAKVQKKSGFDIVNRDEVVEETKVMYSDRTQLSWQKRLELMWRMDEDYKFSPEFDYVFHSSMLATVLGGAIGAYERSRVTTKKFFEKNRYEMFQHPKEAQVALRDRVIIDYIKGFWRMGSRTGLLAFAYLATTQSLTVIRNYINPLDHAVGAAIAGAIYKFNLGPKGMVAGATLGSMLGLASGVCLWLLQYLTGETVEERWSREYHHLKNLQDIENAKITKKDKRQELITGSSYNAEEDHEQDLTLKAFKTLSGESKWLVKLGLISPSEISIEEEEQKLQQSENPKSQTSS